MRFKGFLTLPILLTVIFEVEGRGTNVVDSVLNGTFKLSEGRKNEDAREAKFQSIYRKGRTFFSSMNNDGPPPFGPRAPGSMSPMLMPPPSQPSFYHSYYDFRPFVFLREVGSFFLEILTRVAVMASLTAPAYPPPMDYPDYPTPPPSSDYNNGPPPDWQSEFSESDLYNRPSSYDYNNAGGFSESDAYSSY